MFSHPRKLELQKVLEQIIIKLQSNGLIDPNQDVNDLLDKTMQNLKNALGENLPKEDELKNPLILMKLTLSVIATNKDPANAPINKIFELQTPQQLQELRKTLQLTPPILKFMELCAKEHKENFSPDNIDPDKNKCVGLYAGGVLIDLFENVYATSNLPGEKIQTAEEMQSMTGLAEDLKNEIENAIGSLETAPTLSR